MDDKEMETLENEDYVDSKEVTKEVVTLKDLSLEAISNMEKLYQDDFDESLDEANQVFENRIETLNEEELSFSSSETHENLDSEEKKESLKKENVFQKLKKKWNGLDKKHKTFVILGVIILLILLIFLISFFIFSHHKEEEVPTKDPDVILEMDYYRYENGKLVFLNGKKELGTYHCENKDEKLCKLAFLTVDEVMDTVRKVGEDGKPLEFVVPIFHERFAFVVDNNKEDTKEIKIYDIKEEKILKNVFSVIHSDDYDDFVILKDENGSTGLEKMSDEEMTTVIPYSYDEIHFIPNQSNLEILSVRKDNNFYLTNLENKILTKAINNEIVGATDSYIKSKDASSRYHVYDYNAKEIDLRVNEYVELLDTVMLTIDNKFMYVVDYAGNSMSVQPISLKNSFYNPVETYKDQKRIKKEQSFDYTLDDHYLVLNAYDGDDRENYSINLSEGMLSSKLAFMQYFDGTLYFYSDEDKKTPIGSYACNNKNKVEKDTTELSTCKVASDTVYRETRNARENKEYKEGMIPIIFKEFLFIQDGEEIVLTNVSGGGSAIAKYKSVDTSLYSGIHELSISTENNVMFIAQSSSSNKFGVANITLEGVKPVIPFEKDSIKTLGDYFVVEEKGKYFLYDKTGKKVTNEKPSPIVDYHKDYLKTLKDNQYFVHGFMEDVSTDGYDYIELYDEFYAAVIKGRVHLYRYDDKEKYEYIYEEEKETGIELQLNKYYNNDINAFRITIGNEILVEIGSTNGNYKTIGSFPKEKITISKPDIPEDQDDDKPDDIEGEDSHE